MTAVYLYCIECLMLVKKKHWPSLSYLQVHLQENCGLRKIMGGSKAPPYHEILGSQHLSLWKK